MSTGAKVSVLSKAFFDDAEKKFDGKAYETFPGISGICVSTYFACCEISHSTATKLYNNENYHF